VGVEAAEEFAAEKAHKDEVELITYSYLNRLCTFSNSFQNIKFLNNSHQTYISWHLKKYHRTNKNHKLKHTPNISHEI